MEAKGHGYGPLTRGLTAPMSLGPYYDPRTTTIRAPVEACADGTTLVSAPSMKHGPSAFFGDVGPAPEKTQFAPHGTIEVDPVTLGLYVGPCVCGAAEARCLDINPYSLAALLLAPRMALLVRDRLEDAGVVVVAPVLRDAPFEDMCACRVLGGPEQFSAFLQFASNYDDVSIAQMLEPAAVAANLADQYADQVLGDIRSAVLGKARMNYLRAEGPRAYLEPRPQFFADDDTQDSAPCYPTVLPGTGVRVSREDTPFALRALTDPRSGAANRAALSCQTGLNIGGRLRPADPLAQYSNDCLQRRCGQGTGWCGGAVPSPPNHPTAFTI